MNPINYKSLLRAANTDRQRQIIQAIIDTGSHRKASKLVDLHPSNVDRLVAKLERKALAGLDSADGMHDDMIVDARQLQTPKIFERGGVGASDLRDGTGMYIAEGASTYFKGEGEQGGQWIKTKLDHARYIAALKAGTAAFIEDTVVPVLPPVGPLDFQTDIVPWIQIGDAHLGMLAHAAEVGENFDMKIAEAELCGGISILIDELPNCERLVINDLGDFTHYENMVAQTERSGHQLDFDTRFPKMIKTYSRVMRFIVEKALTKARHVDVIINRGNHSETNDIWMAELLEVAYGGTGRVHVLNNESLFVGYRMGNTLVMTHHSHTAKPKMLANILTHDFRQDFGETEYHYIDIGHVHHGMVMKEHPSVIIESFNHLAGLDRHAHDHGYRNRKSITMILRSRTYGEVGRRLLPIQQIRDRIGAAMPPVRRAFAA